MKQWTKGLISKIYKQPMQLNIKKKKKKNRKMGRRPKWTHFSLTIYNIYELGRYIYVFWQVNFFFLTYMKIEQNTAALN